MAPVLEAIPDVKPDEALAATRSPSSRPAGHAGRPTAVPKKRLPRRRLGALPSRQAGKRRPIATPAAATPRPTGPPIVRRTVGLQTAAIPRTEAAGGVPLGPTVAARLATGPVVTLATGVGALAAGLGRAVAVQPLAVVPAVVVATTATAVPRLAPGAFRLGPALALVAKANAGALRRPRRQVRPATATAVVPTATMTPALLPRVRGVAPAAGVAIPTTTSPTRRTAATTRPSPLVPVVRAARLTAARLTTCLTRQTSSTRRLRLAPIATDTPTAVATLPCVGRTTAPGLAAMTAHAVVLVPAVGPRLLPVGEPRRLAAELTTRQGLMAPAITAVRTLPLVPRTTTSAVPAVHDLDDDFR